MLPCVARQRALATNNSSGEPTRRDALTSPVGRCDGPSTTRSTTEASHHSARHVAWCTTIPYQRVMKKGGCACELCTLRRSHFYRAEFIPKFFAIGEQS